LECKRKNYILWAGLKKFRAHFAIFYEVVTFNLVILTNFERNFAYFELLITKFGFFIFLDLATLKGNEKNIK